jgi:hypothetical protein
LPIIRVARSGADRDEVPVQIPLGLLMVAIGVIGIALAVLVLAPGTAVAALAAILLGYGIHRLVRLPLRTRLIVEVVTALLLLALSAWLWRPPFYVTQAHRAQQLARLCERLAARAESHRAHDLFQREAAWYERKAFGLRLEALGRGLIRAFTREDPGLFGDRELILELGLLESMERHRRIAESMGIRWHGR